MSVSVRRARATILSIISVVATDADWGSMSRRDGNPREERERRGSEGRNDSLRSMAERSRRVATSASAGLEAERYCRRDGSSTSTLRRSAKSAHRHPDSLGRRHLRSCLGQEQK